MKDKLCLITGGSSGVGKATAMSLAMKGAEVIIASRNPVKAQKAISYISRITGNNKILWMQVDLSSQKSIRNFADTFQKKYKKLHLLSNNAGIIQLKREETIDGIEKILAIDYLSHFLITNLLINTIKKAAPSRIITVAGSPRIVKNAKINFKDIQSKRSFSGIKAAIQAARARVLFSAGMAKKLKGTNITCNAFHPGLVRSNLSKNLPFFIKWIGPFINPFLRTQCKTSTYLSISDDVRDITGKFFSNQKPVDMDFDDDEIEKLWRISEKLVGLKN